MYAKFLSAEEAIIFASPYFFASLMAFCDQEPVST